MDEGIDRHSWLSRRDCMAVRNSSTSWSYVSTGRQLGDLIQLRLHRHCLAWPLWPLKLDQAFSERVKERMLNGDRYTEADGSGALTIPAGMLPASGVISSGIARPLSVLVCHKRCAGRQRSRSLDPIALIIPTAARSTDLLAAGISPPGD